MTYFVIGLMSGSSLDGLDIIHTSISFVSGKWEYEINHADCIPLLDDLKAKLSNAKNESVPEFLKLNTAFGRFIGQQINEFKEKHDLMHKIHFIASHGHTVFHDPENFTSTQIGDGATIAAITGYSTITDLRNMDVALGGQGAPIVPIADRLLFADYDFCLNIGGIGNITVNKTEPTAFDICPINQVLNHFAAQKGLEYDEDGNLAAKGTIDSTILAQLNALAYYKKSAPKSLDNDFSKNNILNLLANLSTEDALATAVAHIATQFTQAIQPFVSNEFQKILVTGGGAFNSFLISTLNDKIKEENWPIELIVPDDTLVNYKEALAMALIGALRWREEENVFQSVTGAERSSIGGALWIGA